MTDNATDLPGTPPPATEELATALARQSILDHAGHVFGYELFDRSKAAGGHDAQSDATALFRVLSNAGADALFGKKTLFINCTHHSLSGQHLELVLPEQVVLEVPPVRGHDAAQIEACLAPMQALVQRGFRLAFDHSALTKPYVAWLPLAAFLKIDTTQLKPEVIEPFVRYAQKNTRAQLIADKVETAEQHAKLSGFGVRLFQGYWFSRPVIVKAKLVTPSQATILQLINLVRQEADVDAIEAILKRDPTLSFNLLRFINSSGFGLNSEITSFRHAVMILGLKKLFRWATMLLSASKAGGTPPAVGNLAVLRGRLMENLVGELLSAEDADHAFVVGVFSLLDTMLGMPMEQALGSLSLPDPVCSALLHRTGPLAPFLRLAEVCESGSDDDLARAAEALAISSHQVNMAHLEAIVWTESLLGNPGG